MNVRFIGDVLSLHGAFSVRWCGLLSLPCLCRQLLCHGRELRAQLLAFRIAPHSVRQRTLRLGSLIGLHQLGRYF